MATHFADLDDDEQEDIIDKEIESVVVNCETCGGERIELNALGDCDICEEKKRLRAVKLGGG